MRRPFIVYVKFFFFEPFAKLIRVMPYPPMRVLLLKILGAKIPFSSHVYDTFFFGMEFGGFYNLNVGKLAHIGRDCLIDLNDRIVLEDNVVLSPRVTLLTHQSPGITSPMLKYYPEVRKPVLIQEGAWVGANTTILPGVTIGTMSVIAAGSVVMSDVEPYCMYAGAPAVKKKEMKK